MNAPIDPTKYTASAAWGTVAKDTEKDMTLPSGVTCRVRKPGMEKVMMSGILEMVDSLGLETENVVNPQNRAERRMASQQGLKTVDEAQAETGSKFMSRMAEDPDMFKNMMVMVNKIVAMTVIIPEVELIPQRPNPHFDDSKPKGPQNPTVIDAPEMKQEGVIYVDSIDFEDKFEIMAFGMGDIDKMKQFRDSSDSVGAVQSGEGTEDAPVGAPGSFV